MTKQRKTRRATFRIAKRGLELASVRYRGLIPAVAMQSAGWEIELVSGTEASRNPDIAFAIKPLLKADADWVSEQALRGVCVVVDLCDNIFVPGYGGKDLSITSRFRHTVSLAAAITVPTPALGELLSEQFPSGLPPVFVVPDIVETRSTLRKERALVAASGGISYPAAKAVRAVKAVKDKMLNLLRSSYDRSGVKKLIWFGNHGASYANFGITDIKLFADALRTIAADFSIELWVVSNSRDKFESVVVPIGVPCRYFEWDENRVDALLPLVDVCLVPNSLDEFSRVKSANRALKALVGGVPVVATPTSAYNKLKDAVWLGDPLEGMRRYLSEPALVRRHIGNARVAIAKDFSLPSLQLAMDEIADRISAQANVR